MANMQLNVLLCDSADELARLQYHFLRSGADLAVSLSLGGVSLNLNGTRISPVSILV